MMSAKSSALTARVQNSTAFKRRVKTDATHPPSKPIKSLSAVNSGSRKLVTPRVLAGILMLPLVTALKGFFFFFGGGVPRGFFLVFKWWAVLDPALHVAYFF